MTSLRKALQDDLGITRLRWTYNASVPAQSIAHQVPTAVGQIYESLFSDVNNIKGSGGAWEVANLTVGTAADSIISTSSGKGRFQGSDAQFDGPLNSADLSPSSVFVRTNNSASQQGRWHLARDIAMASSPNRRKLVGAGKTIIGTSSSDAIDLKSASCDLGEHIFIENPLGTAGYLVTLDSSALGLADHHEVNVHVEGVNQGTSSTSGPGGTQGYDFQGAVGQAASAAIPSTATGVLLNNFDSLCGPLNVVAARVLVGLELKGNTEKQHIVGQFAYCGVAIRDYISSGTPDTNYIELTGNQCKQWFITGDDSTGHVRMNAESRLGDGSSFAAAYDAARQIPTPAVLNSNGKGYKYSGEFRGHNDRLIFYIDRLTSSSLAGQGSDTVMFDGFSTIHTYGCVLLADRVSYLEGTVRVKDNGPGRLNFGDTTSTISGPTIQLNRIDKSCPLNLILDDIYTTEGIHIGDVSKGLFPTDIDFGRWDIGMRTADVNYALVLEKAVRCRFSIGKCNANISIGADVSDCQMELSGDFIKRGYQIDKHASATCAVRFTGSVTQAQLAAFPAPFAGMSVEAVSDLGGRPAIYDAGAWKIAAVFTTI